jgi:hypothetical protein
MPVAAHATPAASSSRTPPSLPRASRHSRASACGPRVARHCRRLNSECRIGCWCPRTTNPAVPAIITPASVHEIDLRHMPAPLPLTSLPASNTPLDTRSNAPVPIVRSATGRVERAAATSRVCMSPLTLGARADHPSSASHYASRSASANSVCRAETAVPPKCANETRARRAWQMPHKFVSA